MKFSLINLKDIFLINIAQLYPIGKSRIAPGTLASLITLIIGFYLINNLTKFSFISFLFFSIIISYFSVKHYISLKQVNDPPEIVIDEFIGQLIAMLPFVIIGIEINYQNLLLCFILFRFFDISKIGLKTIEKIPGAWGILLDDIFAGLYSCIIQIILWKSLVI